MTHVNNHNKKCNNIVNSGKNSLYHLCEELENYCKEILLNRETKKCQKLTKHQKQKHQETKQCYYC